ncbi:MAG: type II secretion system GspH family protein [Planctomycetales bacterium]|nr:type II secretion system GspH family protein [Planctomycetales bacterium]
MENKRVSKNGFTIVELLTVMGVIVVLIGLMVPALALVKDYSKRIQQKAQFHGIDMGLEMYKTEMGSYPGSNDDSLTVGGDPYCGANKLAEALVGLDLIGFHPSSSLRYDGMSTVNLTTGSSGSVVVYNAEVDTPNWQTVQENMGARKGPFVDLEKVNAFRMNEVYNPANLGSFAQTTRVGSSTMYPLVLCDVYAQKRSGIGAKKTGTPILYYRAHTNFKFQDSTVNNDSVGTADDDDIYSYYDNEQLLLNGMPDDGTVFTVQKPVAPLTTPFQMFEKMIVNENIQTIRRPYRADSFILISAGKDGDFGTDDDVFNFDKEVTE